MRERRCGADVIKLYTELIDEECSELPTDSTRVCSVGLLDDAGPTSEKVFSLNVFAMAVI